MQDAEERALGEASDGEMVFEISGVGSPVPIPSGGEVLESVKKESEGPKGMKTEAKARLNSA